MKVKSPGGGIADVKDEQVEKLLALGWSLVEAPKGQDKPKTARTRRTKKTE